MFYLSKVNFRKTKNIPESSKKSQVDKDLLRRKKPIKEVQGTTVLSESLEKLFKKLQGVQKPKN
jgi:hypothetical protein